MAQEKPLLWRKRQFPLRVMKHVFAKKSVILRQMPLLCVTKLPEDHIDIAYFSVLSLLKQR